MDHQNIARVLDAGATGAGRPFFVMELVRGIPITEYCDAHRLTPRERLELFVTVCHAVQHAHQKGVIHRDLKPSNVLVALHDDRPVAKVIDFGIAKATSGPLTDKTVFTAFAQMIGTPLYMSPEQASGALDVDTRSDVYSLGVLLYELLTGTTPFGGSGLKSAAFDEMRRIIREEEPQRPSTRLSAPETLPSVAANRGTEPARLTRLVRGELDWIVMKALEKDRTRRYETANGLAMDVQRYLADDAVLACPPSVGYRLGKLARRNRRTLAVIAFAGAMLLVVAGSIGWVARDGAARRARTAEAVAALLDQCEAALKADATDRAAVALEAAERRAAEGGAGEFEGRLARGRADLALVRELDAIDAFSWTPTNDLRPSAPELSARWAGALAQYGVTPDEARAEETAARVNGSLVRDRMLTALDRWLSTERSSDLRRGLQLVLRSADPDAYRDAVRAAVATRDRSAMIELAGRSEALAQPTRFAAALGVINVVPVGRGRAVLADAVRDRPGDLVLLMGLGISYGEGAGDAQGVGERLRWFQAAVAAHPGNVEARLCLGIALEDRGDLDGALLCYQDTVRLDPNFSRGHHNMGVVFGLKGEEDKAIACYRKAIRVDPSYAPGHCMLGIALQAKGDVDGAIACHEEAVRLAPTEVIYHRNLGVAFRAKGDPARAIACYEEAIRLNPSVVASHAMLGDLCWAEGDIERASSCFEQVIRLDASWAPGHYNLGSCLKARGDPAAAIARFQEAIRLDPSLACAYGGVGGALMDMGNAAQAIPWLEKAIQLDERHSQSHFNLGTAKLAVGDPAGAIACHQEALRIDPNVARVHHGLGTAFGAMGEMDQAIACFERAIQLDPSFARAHYNLGVTYCIKGGPFGPHGEGFDHAFVVGRLDVGTSSRAAGDLDRAVACLEEAIRQKPDYALAYNSLGVVLEAKGDHDRAIACFEAATRLNRKDALTHSNLGAAYLGKGDPDRAIVCLEEAIRLDPNCAPAHHEMGNALWAKGDPDGAVARYQEAVRLDPGGFRACVDLGTALQARGDLAGAIAACRKAIEVEPDCTEAYFAIGACLRQLGRFEEALESVRKGHDLGRRRPGWSDPSDRSVQDAERLVALDARLPHVLAGQAAAPDELAGLAEMCLLYKRRYADAAMLYARAFVVAPSLALEPRGRRYNAACAAALAAGGHGVGAEQLGASDKARLRALALDWLMAELTAYGDLPAGDPAAAAEARGQLERWLSDPDLSCVRDDLKLEALPDGERQRWTRLWNGVRDLVARAAKK